MNLELDAKSAAHRKSGQVWLPNAQVWARIPVKPVVEGRKGFAAGVRRTDRSVDITSVHGTTSSMQELGPLQGQLRHGSSQEHAPGSASAEEPSARASFTFFELAEQPLDLPQQPLSEVDLISDEDSEGGLPVCPICLGEIFDLRDKAVVISCMHVFCLACLSRWSSLKKSCPLCKSRIQGYMYNILSETDYQERILPATPPRAKTPPSPGPTAERQRALPLIDARPSSSRGDARTRASSRFGERAPAFRQGSRDLAGEFVPGRWPPVRAARRQEAATSSRQVPLKEPRPYFYRVQAQAQSQVQGGPLAGRGGPRTSKGLASLEDAAEAWRRHIYVQGLRAVPMGDDVAAGHPSMSEERRDARLSAWVDRELRALLQTDDVAIVRAYVMGLVRGIGFPRPGGGDGPPSHGSGPSAAPPPDGSITGRGGEHRDAVAALRPFLQEHAEHFWHELRCFAAVPLSMQTYDRLVQYHTRPPAAASSPVTVPSTESSSAVVYGAPLHGSRVGGSANDSPVRREGAAVERGREHHINTQERSRKRRRFSSHPPEDAQSEMTASRRESDRRRDYMHHEELSAGGLGTRKEQRGRRRHESAARSGHRETACHETSSNEQAGAGSTARGEDVLADLRAKALAALQARRCAAEQG
ncbi:g2299 [Coccomyxa elongata]